MEMIILKDENDFRCEINSNSMKIWNGYTNVIYTEHFVSPVTDNDLPNLRSQFNLVVGMRAVRTSENSETIKRVIYCGNTLVQLQVVKDPFSYDWIAMFFDSNLKYMTETRIPADSVHSYVESQILAKGIPGYVFRSGLGDCTNNGISASHDRLFILSKDGYSVPSDIRELVQIERQYIRSAEYVSVKPVYKADRWYMSGGNFLFSCDARFKEVTGIDYPVPIHDRHEG